MGCYAAIAQPSTAAVDHAPNAPVVDSAVVAPAPLPEVPAAVVKVAPVETPPASLEWSAAPKAKPQAVEPISPKATTPPPLKVDSAEAFIDNTDYKLGATEYEEVPIEIITRNPPTEKQRPSQPVPSRLPGSSTVRSASVQVGSINLSSAGIGWQPQAVAPPNSSSIVSPGRAYLDQKLLQPLGAASQSLLRMMFPLAIPAPITSLFGWRIHPISGVQRLHTGTDLGAPMGTPVMAAMSGRVILADDLGGYGLTVAIAHDNGMRQTLYGHLSELFVRPGDVVQQGTVIGRVGSTGASTGPHLHFELRQMMPDGTWVALDAGQQLETSMAGLVRSLQIAQQQQKVTAQRPTPPKNN